MLDSNWTKTTLGDVAKLQYGKARKDDSTSTGKVPVYGSGGIYSFQSEFLVDKDCLVIGRKGNVGSVYYVKGPSWPVDTVYYTFGSKNVNLKYLYYLLLDISFENMDTVKPGLNREYAESKEITIPNIEYQNKVVKSLEIFENKINNLDKTEKLLKSIITKIYENYFLDFGILESSNLNLEKKGRLGYKIPSNWNMENFLKNNLFSINSEKIEKFSGLKKYVDTRNVGDGYIKDFELIDYANKKSRADLKIKKNSILIAKMINSKKHYYFMNHSDQFVNDFVFSTGFLNIVPSEISFEYVTALTMHWYFEKQKNFIGYAKSTQQAINNTELMLIDLMVPDQETLLKFKEDTNLYFKKIEQLRNQKLEAIDIKNKLASQLIIGNLKI